MLANYTNSIMLIILNEQGFANFEKFSKTNNLQIVSEEHDIRDIFREPVV